MARNRVDDPELAYLRQVRMRTADLCALPSVALTVGVVDMHAARLLCGSAPCQAKMTSCKSHAQAVHARVHR